eukprot:TRINITY_DN15304_c0_g1_i1.p2 TRINITY_DN15304_c0_g1~~TRINITY_DN15304_c0_g1_i1.p2  ORF type:complete len:147 (+),score=31.39 TRINITY_DN15304_c0_g1_i1:16-456(+)
MESQAPVAPGQPLKAPAPAAPAPNLARMLKEHEGKHRALREQSEHHRKAGEETAAMLTHAMVDTVNVGVAQVFATQRQIEREAQELQKQSARFCKQTQDWLTMIAKFNDSLKELGDVENWAMQIEHEMKSMATALEYVHKEATPRV